MVWPASKQQAGGDRAEAKQHNVVKEVKNSGTPISMYQFPFHSLSLNKVKNIEVDRLRLSFTTPQKPTTLVPVGSDEESDDDQECSDDICSGLQTLHAIPRKNKSRSTKKRVRKSSYKEYYRIFFS
uniref:Uncharacterized protein n=1 Tax=Avena sativa TaxID=4498 RepID=A0ACD5ZXH1_AVESA